VELPLALPVIVAGVRTATVWIVGIATLSTPVGSPSLGNFIFSGLQTRNFTAVGVGCVAAAALALALDGIVRLAESGVSTRRPARVVASAAMLGLFAAWAIAAAAGVGGPRDEGRAVVIGAKTFTESYILAEILAATVERGAHLPVRVTQSLGSTVAFDALRSGDIDAYVDYSGTIWATVLGEKGRPPARAEVLRTVARELRRRHRIEVLANLGFENAYALAMRARDADDKGVRRISDLARVSRDLSIGADYEFLSRPEWRALEETYGLDFATKRSMDPALMYQAAGQGTVDVISAFSTDGRIESFHLRVLEDDRHAIPPYDAIVLAGPNLPAAARTALRRLEGTIDAAEMRAMNAAVDDAGRRPRAVARDFLR
jgi:osmoprotectant transport system permease protein